MTHCPSKYVQAFPSLVYRDFGPRSGSCRRCTISIWRCGSKPEYFARGVRRRIGLEAWGCGAFHSIDIRLDNALADQAEHHAHGGKGDKDRVARLSTNLRRACAQQSTIASRPGFILLGKAFIRWQWLWPSREVSTTGGRRQSPSVAGWSLHALGHDQGASRGWCRYPHRLLACRLPLKSIHLGNGFAFFGRKHN